MCFIPEHVQQEQYKYIFSAFAYIPLTLDRTGSMQTKVRFKESNSKVKANNPVYRVIQSQLITFDRI